MTHHLGRVIFGWSLPIILVSLLGSANAADPPCRKSKPVDCCTKSKQKKPVSYTQLAYPICFFDTDQGTVAIAEKFWQTYPQKIESILRSQSKYFDLKIGTSRVVFIRATPFRHKQIAKIWPEVACVGSSGGHESSGKLRRCKSYFREYVDGLVSGKSPYTMPDEPICQTFIAADIN